MTKLYEKQKEILKLFQGEANPNLHKSEIDSLNLYKGLVISSAESLLAKIFKEIHQFYENQWQEIIMDYIERYSSQSPIYNKLCKDFPEFLASEFFDKKYGSNNYFASLALFKWLDLDLYNSKAKAPLKNGLIQDFVILETDFNMPGLINFLNSGEKINKDDNIERSPCTILIFRDGSQTKNLILNSLSKEFIEELKLDKSLDQTKALFLEKYSKDFNDLDKNIDALLSYLKKMKILLT